MAYSYSNIIQDVEKYKRYLQYENQATCGKQIRHILSFKS